MERYLMYLRKSRMDTDYDEVSVEETLSRHRKILEDLCRTKRLNVVEILEEVVSGESLMARPRMMRLLELISTGMYAGVVCMDIERLSRGSSIRNRSRADRAATNAARKYLRIFGKRNLLCGDVYKEKFRFS